MRTTTVVIAAIGASLALGLSLGACKSKDGGGAGGSAASGASGGASGAGSASGGGSADDGVPLPPAVAVDDAGARALIDAWLGAQNGGDFAAYSALYAPKIEGIKRVGARTWRFDRDGWLKDRQRMFKKPMTVGARDVVVRGGGLAVTVELIQTFQQGTFQDEGPKRLVLMKGPSGFQIAREEMLRSVVAGAPAAGQASAYVVVTIGGKPHVAISPGAKAAWGNGRLHGPFTDTHELVTMTATKAPAAATWSGRALTVHGEDGAPCDAKVGELKLVAGGTPHFGEVQVWKGDPDMSDDGRVWTPAEIAGAVWNMSDPYLVGELSVTGDCKPVVAVDPGGSAVVLTREAGASTDAAVAAFRKLPAYRDLQRDYTENYDGKGDWAAPTATVFAGGGRRFVVVSASEGSGCGDFLGQLSVIFEDKGGALTALPAPSGFLQVKLLLDSDGDGAIEAIGTIDDFRMLNGHFEATGSDFVPLSEVTFPNNDCGC